MNDARGVSFKIYNKQLGNCLSQCSYSNPIFSSSTRLQFIPPPSPPPKQFQT